MQLQRRKPTYEMQTYNLIYLTKVNHYSVYQDQMNNNQKQ